MIRIAQVAFKHMPNATMQRGTPLGSEDYINAKWTALQLGSIGLTPPRPGRCQTRSWLRTEAGRQRCSAAQLCRKWSQWRYASQRFQRWSPHLQRQEGDCSYGVDLQPATLTRAALTSNVGLVLCQVDVLPDVADQWCRSICTEESQEELESRQRELQSVG